MTEKELYDSLHETMDSREEVYNGKILHVVKDGVTLPSGRKSKREVVLHNGAVCVVPVTANNEIIMERQFRYPFDEVIWEIPAGKLDKAGEDRLDAAKRELKEETGYEAANFRFIGDYYGSPAILNERIGMYLATGLTLGEQQLDEGEFLTVEKVPFAKVVDMILSGEIKDGKTISAVLKAKLLLNL